MMTTRARKKKASSKTNARKSGAGKKKKVKQWTLKMGVQGSTGEPGCS
jgi:hypothetical protein